MCVKAVGAILCAILAIRSCMGRRILRGPRVRLSLRTTSSYIGVTVATTLRTKVPTLRTNSSSGEHCCCNRGKWAESDEICWGYTKSYTKYNTMPNKHVDQSFYNAIVSACCKIKMEPCDKAPTSEFKESATKSDMCYEGRERPKRALLVFRCVDQYGGGPPDWSGYLKGPHCDTSEIADILKEAETPCSEIGPGMTVEKRSCDPAKSELPLLGKRTWQVSSDNRERPSTSPLWFPLPFNTSVYKTVPRALRPAEYL